MAYPIGGESGPCPSTHKTRVVTLFYEIMYVSLSFSFSLSSDADRVVWMQVERRPVQQVPLAGDEHDSAVCAGDG